MWHKQQPGYEVVLRNAVAERRVPSLRVDAEKDPCPTPHHLSPVTCSLRKNPPKYPSGGVDFLPLISQ